MTFHGLLHSHGRGEVVHVGLPGRGADAIGRDEVKQGHRG